MGRRGAARESKPGNEIAEWQSSIRPIRKKVPSDPDQRAERRWRSFLRISEGKFSSAP
jgi:hypothetical protein